MEVTQRLGNKGGLRRPPPSKSKNLKMFMQANSYIRLQRMCQQWPASIRHTYSSCQVSWLHASFSAEVHLSSKSRNIYNWVFTNPYPSHQRLRGSIFSWVWVEVPSKCQQGWTEASTSAHPALEKSSLRYERRREEKYNTGLQGTDITAHTSVGTWTVQIAYK